MTARPDACGKCGGLLLDISTFTDLGNGTRVLLCRDCGNTIKVPTKPQEAEIPEEPAREMFDRILQLFKEKSDMALPEAKFPSFYYGNIGQALEIQMCREFKRPGEPLAVAFRTPRGKETILTFGDVRRLIQALNSAMERLEAMQARGEL